MTDGEEAVAGSGRPGETDSASREAGLDAASRVDFSALTETQFEELVVDLLAELGYLNLVWHKGTPTDASPADDGKDVTAFRRERDADGHEFESKWFVDAKHYRTRGVPREVLASLLAAAQADRADVALFVVSGFLSNAAARYLREYEANNRPNFRIRVWDRYKLERLPVDWERLAARHDIGVRHGQTQSAIQAAARRMSELLWYDDAVKLRDEAEFAGDPLPTSWAREGVEQRILEIEARYPEANLPPWSDEDRYDAQGRLAALLWTLGGDWDEVSS